MKIEDVLTSADSYMEPYEDLIYVLAEKEDDSLKVYLSFSGQRREITDLVDIKLDTEIGNLKSLIKGKVDANELFKDMQEELQEEHDYTFNEVNELLDKFEAILESNKINLDMLNNDPELFKRDKMFQTHWNMYKIARTTNDTFTIKMVKTPGFRISFGKALNYIIKKYS